MKEQSDTPRTDSAARQATGKIFFHLRGWVLANALERELATATRERDEARAEVERLRSTLIDVVNQIRKCDPVDELGHRMTMNRACLEAETLLDSAATEAKP